MRRALALLSLLPLAMTISDEQDYFDGKCPKIPAMRHFNAVRYLRKWFHYKRYGIISTRCDREIYKKYADSETTFRFIKRYEEEPGDLPVFNHLEKVIKGWLVPVKQRRGKGFGRYRSTMDIKKNYPKPSARPNYIILSTDYVRYSIVWSCVNNPWELASGGSVDTNLQTLRILTTEPNVSSELDEEISRIVKAFGLDTGKLKRVEQENCKKDRI